MKPHWPQDPRTLARIQRIFEAHRALSGANLAISLGDVWMVLRNRYPEDIPVQVDSPAFARLVRWVVLDLLRRERCQVRRVETPHGLVIDDLAWGGRDPLGEMLQVELVIQLEQALAELPDVDQALILARSEKRSTTSVELARSLNVSRRTIKRRENAAGEQMRNKLAASGHIGDVP